MKDEPAESVGPLAKQDAGGGEIVFGLMFLAYALIGYLDSMWEEGTRELLLTVAILVLAWGISAPWINKAILKHAIWPRAGYWAHRRENPVLIAGGTSRRKNPLIILLLGIALAAFVLGGLAALPGWPEGVVSVLGIVIFAGLLGSYAFWFLIHDRREHPWKWLALLLMAAGFFAIGIPVRGDYFAVWPRVLLFAGAVWLLSGGVTLCSYLRQPKLCSANPE